MACNETWLEILSAWHDGEATTDEVARARAHLPHCSACTASRARFQLLRAALRSAHQFSLHERASPQKPPAPVRRPGRRAIVAGVLVAAAAVLVLARVPSFHQDDAVVVDELEARHLTAVASRVDFESSDPAAVRTWIATDLGHDVDVPIVPGARLLGARRCHLSGRPTVSIMYRRGKEPLSLFLPPAGTAAEVETGLLARARTGCTVAPLGSAVCARPGLFAVAETRGTALAALQSF